MNNDSARCKQLVHRRNTWGMFQCKRLAKKGGYCTQHHPDSVKKRNAEGVRRRQEERDRCALRHARNARNARNARRHARNARNARNALLIVKLRKENEKLKKYVLELDVEGLEIYRPDDIKEILKCPKD